MSIIEVRKDAAYRAMKDIISLINNVNTVYDVGGRNGCDKLLKKVKNVIILDRNKEMLARARRKGFRTICCDLNYKLPLKSNSIEAYFCANLVEHIVNIDILISEMWRTLKPGGTLFILTPNLVSLHNRFLFLFGKLPTCCCVSDLFYVGSSGEEGISHRHIRMHTFSSLARLFELHGFDSVLMKGSGFYPSFLNFMSGVVPTFSVYIIAVFRKGKVPKDDVRRLLYRKLYDDDMELLKRKLLDSRYDL